MLDLEGLKLQDKIFLVGVTGSGKSTLARKISKYKKIKLIDIDAQFDFDSPYNQSKKILSKLPNKFIMDGIPPNEKRDGIRSWDDFSHYERNNTVTTICIYCSSKSEWIKRHKNRLEGINNLYINWVDKFIARCRKVLMIFLIIGRNTRTINDFTRQMKRNFNLICKRNIGSLSEETDLNELYKITHIKFLDTCVPRLNKYKDVRYYDSVNEQLTTKEEFISRVNTAVNASNN
jgi:dephospho-CoA kinase